MYTATERLYATPDGKVLREAELTPDTSAVLLVAEGGSLTDEEAKSYGLTDDAKAKAPAANKARSSSENKGA